MIHLYQRPSLFIRAHQFWPTTTKGEAMKEVTEQFLAVVSQVVEGILNDSALIHNMAKIMARMYGELVEAGFTQDQAFQLTATFASKIYK